MDQAVDPDGKSLYRWGGISAILLAIGYIVLIALYVPIGARPSGAEDWLTYVGEHTTIWWTILILSVLTDLLYIPLAFALYFALKGINRNLMLFSATFLVLFVALDLAITWANYGAIIRLATQYAAATTDAQREILITAATLPTMMLDSTLLAFYIIAVPGIGILLAGLVMLKGLFNKATAYTGIATGILAIISVVGPFVVSALGMIGAILASTLTMIWCFLAGYRLYRLSRG